MPIYVVGSSNQRVVIPTHALAVTITGAVSGAELDIRAGAEQPVVRASAHHAVLPRLTGPVSIAVRPAGAARFAPGSVIHLAIAHDDGADVDPVQVLFDPVDVSGDVGVVFAALTPRGAQIEVGVSAVADVALSPLGAAARSSARKVIGRAPARAGGTLVIALDASASMSCWFADGSVAAAADIVVGVAAAVGTSDVSAVLVGSEIVPLGAGDGGLAAAVRDARPRWSAGARWSRLRPDIRTVVCTDYPTEAVRQRFPMLALSNDRRLDATSSRLPAPRTGEDPANVLLAYPQLLDQITGHLARALA